MWEIVISLSPHNFYKNVFAPLSVLVHKQQKYKVLCHYGQKKKMKEKKTATTAMHKYAVLLCLGKILEKS